MTQDSRGQRVDDTDQDAEASTTAPGSASPADPGSTTEGSTQAPGAEDPDAKDAVAEE